jgi:alkylhydroperoxidase family enzyme
MARVELIEEYGPEISGLVDRIKRQRRGTVLKLYKALLHSPALAETWLEHLNAVRWKTELTGRLRELVIIRIAFIHAVHYVIRQHIPKLAEADGVTPEECAALREGADSLGFSDAERAALAYAETMTLATDVPDDVFERLALYFSERQIVDLTVLVATYNMHIRVVKALRIEPEET